MYVNDDSKARQAHADFLRAYGKTREEFPLVRYIPGEGFVDG